MNNKRHFFVVEIAWLVIQQIHGTKVTNLIRFCCCNGCLRMGLRLAPGKREMHVVLVSLVGLDAMSPFVH